ncbi:MAG: hypothetical protein HKN64_01510 [Woeseiaceae bacterium]|nr:hypothetical protein [Woeseiaceae bacterium]
MAIGGWSTLFLLCVLVYWPGLRGPFLLDDFATLAALGEFGGVTDWPTFKAFVFGGSAGPTGRPLALLSFLVDANDWPADPWPFKRTNLVIHLVNGALLGILTNKLLALLQLRRNDARWVALISTAAWLLHPLLVSTTLYSVQRMAQLATLFVFAGLLLHLYGRSFLQRQPQKAYLVMSGSLGLFTVLAALCKESGILLPILIGVLEITVIASQGQRLAALNRYWQFAFIVLPAFVIAAFLVSKITAAGFYDVLPPRDFSAYERALTQPRVLVDYLRHWFVPSPDTSSVFQDHFIKSDGLFSPLTTALSMLLLAAMMVVAVLKRRQWPLFAAAVMFFFGSHLLESTVLNLELYFEHRNYLAAALLFLPPVAWLQRTASRPLFFVVAASALLLLAGLTRHTTTIWADYLRMVETSSRVAPTSARAQAEYATQLFNAARYEEALSVIDTAIENAPGPRPTLQVNRLVMRCNLGILAREDLDRVAAALSTATYDTRSIKSYTALIDAFAHRLCPDVPLTALRALLSGMREAKQNSNPASLAYSHLSYFIGLVDVQRGAPQQAVEAFQASLRAAPGAEKAMAMAANLATNEYFEQALYFSDLALSELARAAATQLKPGKVRESDIRAFQATVRSEMQSASGDAERREQQE